MRERESERREGEMEGERERERKGEREGLRKWRERRLFGKNVVFLSPKPHSVKLKNSFSLTLCSLGALWSP